MLNSPEEKDFALALFFPQLTHVMFFLLVLVQMRAFVFHHQNTATFQLGHKVRVEVAAGQSCAPSASPESRGQYSTSEKWVFTFLEILFG